MRKGVLATVFVFLILGCKENVNESSSLTQNTKTVVQKGNGFFSDLLICRATISAYFGQEPKTVNVEKKADYFELSYVRSSDHSVWEYKCKVEGQRIVWGINPGRWRLHSADGVFSYAVSDNGEHIRIFESYDGSVSIETKYNYKQLL